MYMYLHKLDTIIVAPLDRKAHHTRESSFHLLLGNLVSRVGGQTRVEHTLNLIKQ